ncbi:MAG: hypothetical protein JWM20_928 [Patescibacteria group bacterium]|nr:hypothetical protein [Patescibacteria group bacterium]
MDNSGISGISFQENPDSSDFWNYFFLVIREFRLSWAFYIFIIRLFWSDVTTFVVIKRGGDVIGGFGLTQFPIAKYKPHNWFNANARAKIDELRSAGYLGGCCFFIAEKFRSRGIGTQVLFSYFKDKPLKIYFTSSRGARSLYLRNGAKVFYPSTYDIFTFENPSYES